MGRAVTQGAVKGIGGTATLEIGGLEQRPVRDAKEVHDHVQALRWVVKWLAHNRTSWRRLRSGAGLSPSRRGEGYTLPFEGNGEKRPASGQVGGAIL